MRNAKVEFLEFIKDKPKVVCAELEGIHYRDSEKFKPFYLYEGYSQKDYEDFLTKLDFKYDGGYGTQYLSGTIWFEDGTFADRGEYDGSEWWEYHKPPAKPQSGSKGKEK